jgi:transcriptional repressor NrdR
MKCPFCGHEDSKVTDSRNASETNAVRRRRECLKCSHRFTTFETVDLAMQVHKRDGRYEDFQIEKLIRGLASACRHTRISHEMVRTLASEISAEIMEKQVRSVEATELGELVMKRLQKLDTIAYIRFACVYRRFKDMDELMHAIEKITPSFCTEN